MKLTSWEEKGASLLARGILSNGPVRRFFIRKFENWLYDAIVNHDSFGRPRKVQEDKFYLLRALLYSAERNIQRGYFSKDVARRMIENLVKGAFMHSGKDIEAKFKEKYGYGPPSFLVISPTKACNLHCIGCYAASGKAFHEKLPFDVVNRIVNEVKELWGGRFIVISGGEPMVYEDNGKTILDVYEQHRDMFFLMFTNGTLITEDVAKRMADLANITPTISVEGFEKETDARRGKGVYKKVMEAIERLKKYGVPFGLSITGTRLNADLLSSDEFYDFYFEEVGTTHMWIFQYMPIGRGFTLDLMPTPEQRMKMYWQWRKVMIEKKYFVADFWNSGVVSDGCIAYGRPGGYLYIDWNGNVMPCVFIPYYVDNIIDIYNKGGNLTDAIMSDFFKKGREWQFNYGYLKSGDEVGNWLMPCSIRDNHREFMRIAEEAHVKPEDENAAIALKDQEYHQGLIEYDEKLRELTEPIWEEMFLEKEKAKV